MALLTINDVINQMKAYLAATRPDISTQPGNVITDVVINSPAQQFGITYQTLAQTQELQSLEFASNMTTGQLDSFGANYGMVRLLGTVSTSTITFRIRNYNFGSSIINIPIGTVGSTISSTNVPVVTFITSSSLVFFPSLAPSYFNPVSGFYEQSVTIVSTSVGSTNNVGAGTITQLVTLIPGIDAVINTIAATGGTNVESNTVFAQRIVIKLSGNNIGTLNGILSLTEAVSGVQQAIVVGPNDPDMIRDQFGGSVDVYIRGQIISSIVDTPQYFVLGSQNFVLTHQPALSVSSIMGVLGGVGGHIFIPTVDYNFVENPNILFSGSTEAESYVQWLSGGGAQHPDNATVFTVSYTYDSLVETAQSIFNNDSNHIVASDILVKEAVEAFIGVTENITILPGYVASTVVNNVQTALTNYINGLGLGAIINLSDIVTVTESAAGVDAVDLNTLSVSSAIGIVTTIIPPGQRVVVGKIAYTQTGTLVIITT